MQRKQSSAAPEDEVPKLLRIIIRLLIERQISGDKMTMNNAITMLDSMHLRPTEIGEIIGWSTNSVTGKLTQLKKAKNK
jgi:hypothetical protein